MLNAMSDTELWESAKATFSAERVTIVQTIRHLREIEKRNLELKLGYGSLLDACQKEFKLERTPAFQRIACLRLCDEVPEVEAKLESGVLSMSLVALLRRFFRKQDDAGRLYDYEQKTALIQKIEGLSCMDAQKYLSGLDPEFTDPDGADFVTDKMVKIRAHIHEESFKDANKLKGLLSHKYPSLALGELFEVLIRDGIKKYGPKADETVSDSTVVPTSELEVKKDEAPSESRMKRSWIPAATRRKVWAKAADGCAFESEITKRRCGSHYMLEIDHIIALADGGTDEPANLRLCCDKHNRFRSKQRFGEAWKKHKKRRK